MVKLINSNYNKVIIHANKCYAFYNFIKYDEIQNKIRNVALLENLSEGGDMESLGMGALIGSSFGISGVIGGIFGARACVKIYCRVYLNNGTEFDIITDDIKLILFLRPFMKVLPS